MCRRAAAVLACVLLAAPARTADEPPPSKLQGEVEVNGGKTNQVVREVKP